MEFEKEGKSGLEVYETSDHILAQEVDVMMNELASMEQQDYEEHVFTDYEDQFQRFLAIAILLIVIEFFISERRNRVFTDWEIFKTKEA